MAMSSSPAHYAGLFSLSSVTSSAWLRGGVLSCIRSVRDLDDNCSRMLHETFLMAGSRLKLHSSVEVPRFAVMDVSPSGNNSVTIVHKEDKPVLTVQSMEGVSFKVDASGIHGKVVGDNNLGGWSWSSDEKYFVYVAMEKTEEVKSSFEKPPHDERNRFDYKEDWGEKYDGVAKLSLCVLSVKTGRVAVVPGIDSSLLTVGQPVFRPSSGKAYTIAYTGWKTSPRRLGMIYCFQRPSSILAVDVTSLLATLDSEERAETKTLEHRLLSQGVYTGRSPRFDPQGESIVFLGSINQVASHNSNFQLLKVDIDSSLSASSVEVVIDKVDLPNAPDGFPGLFCDQLPRSCFVSPKELVLTSMWGSAETALLVSLDTKEVVRLSNLLSSLEDDGKDESADGVSIASCSVLEAAEGSIVFVASSPVRQQILGLYLHESKQIFSSFAPAIGISSKSLPVGLNQSPQTFLSALRWKVFKFQDESGTPYDSILITPMPQDSISTPLPVIVAIHGGPHSASPTAFLAAYAFFSSYLKASILHVNYRGSTGFGLKSINSLLGNVGY